MNQREDIQCNNSKYNERAKECIKKMHHIEGNSNTILNKRAIQYIKIQQNNTNV